MRGLDMRSVLCSLCDQTKAAVEALGATEVVLGLSGGLDSSVVAALACDALGATHVHGVLLPGPYSSEGSVKDAQELASRLGMATMLMPITECFSAFRASYQAAVGEELSGLASENTQARLRMCVLMALSNAHGWVVLNTGNLSEAAMGYSTLYGDTAGAFAPLGGLYKTEVLELARFINEAAVSQGGRGPIPEEVLLKPPSAELAEGQSDEAALGMSYAALDRLLFQMLDEGISPAAISSEAEAVWERYKANEFKRALEPPFARIDKLD